MTNEELKEKKKADKDLTFRIKHLANKFIKRNRVIETYDCSVVDLIKKAYICAYRICIHHCHSYFQVAHKEIKGLKEENEQLKAQIAKQYGACSYRSTDMGCDYCYYKDRNLKEEWLKMMKTRNKRKLDKSKILTCATASKARIGMKGIFADNLLSLKSKIEKDIEPLTLIEVLGDKNWCRFRSEEGIPYLLFYPIEEQ